MRNQAVLPKKPVGSKKTRRAATIIPATPSIASASDRQSEKNASKISCGNAGAGSSIGGADFSTASDRQKGVYDTRNETSKDSARLLQSTATALRHDPASKARKPASEKKEKSALKETKPAHSAIPGARLCEQQPTANEEQCADIVQENKKTAGKGKKPVAKRKQAAATKGRDSSAAKG